LQIKAMKELAMIAKFRKAAIEQKRMMWQEVCNTIEAGILSIRHQSPRIHGPVQDRRQGRYIFGIDRRLGKCLQG